MKDAIIGHLLILCMFACIGWGAWHFATVMILFLTSVIIFVVNI